jgi:hypothetical protein
MASVPLPTRFPVFVHPQRLEKETPVLGLSLRTVLIAAACSLPGCHPQAEVVEKPAPLCYELHFSVARAFPGEQIQVFSNDRLLYGHAVTRADSLQAYRFRQTLCLHSVARVRVRVLIRGHAVSAMPLDTVLQVTPARYSYSLAVGFPIRKGATTIEEIQQDVARRLPLSQRYRPVVLIPDTAIVEM